VLQKFPVSIWFDAVKERAGCPAAELADRYHMPVTARFDLYEALTRRPMDLTLQAIDEVVSRDTKLRAPFGGTSRVYLVGPDSLMLWDALSADATRWRIIVNHELRQVFTEKQFSSGLSFQSKMNALFDLVHGGKNVKLPDSPEPGQTHHVTVRMLKDIGGVHSRKREPAMQTWRSYVVTAIAAWQIAQSTRDSWGKADYLLLGLLSGPLDELFGQSGAALHEFVVRLMLRKTQRKHVERHKAIAAYAKYMKVG
jgi:hypothetical protein